MLARLGHELGERRRHRRRVRAAVDQYQQVAACERRRVDPRRTGRVAVDEHQRLRGQVDGDVAGQPGLPRQHAQRRVAVLAPLLLQLLRNRQRRKVGARVAPQPVHQRSACQRQAAGQHQLKRQAQDEGGLEQPRRLHRRHPAQQQQAEQHVERGGPGRGQVQAGNTHGQRERQRAQAHEQRKAPLGPGRRRRARRCRAQPPAQQRQRDQRRGDAGQLRRDEEPQVGPVAGRAADAVLHRMLGIAQGRKARLRQPGDVRGHPGRADRRRQQHRRPGLPAVHARVLQQPHADDGKPHQRAVLGQQRQGRRRADQCPLQPAPRAGRAHGGQHRPQQQADGQQLQGVVVGHDAAQAVIGHQRSQHHRHEGAQRRGDHQRHAPHAPQHAHHAELRGKKRHPHLAPQQLGPGIHPPGGRRRVLVVAPLQRLRPHQLLDVVPRRRAMADARQQCPQQQVQQQERQRDPAHVARVGGVDGQAQGWDGQVHGARCGACASVRPRRAARSRCAGACNRTRQPHL